MDAVSIVAIIAGVGGVVISIYTHIKHSKCCGLEVDNFDPQLIPQPSPIISQKTHETQI
jgi:hypothetical protein